MPFSPTANRISDAIDASDLTHREIADRVGIKHVSVVAMMKQGVTRVPLHHIPALSQTLGMNERDLLMLAIEEYHPGVHEVLCDVLGLPLTDAELGILTMFRLAELRGDLEMRESLVKVLEGALELAAKGGV